MEASLDDVHTDKDAGDSNGINNNTGKFRLLAMKFLNDLADIAGYPYDETFKIRPDYGRIPNPSPPDSTLKVVKKRLDQLTDSTLSNQSKKNLLLNKVSAIMDLVELDKVEAASRPPATDSARLHRRDPHRERILANMQEYGGPVEVEGKTMYQCYKCMKIMNGFNHLYGHIKLVHLKIKDYVCPDCGLAFFNNGRLQIHIESRHRIDLNKYKCPVCSEKFHSREILRTHKYRKHVKVFKPPEVQQPAVCEVCGLTLAGLDTLKRHYKTHSTETPFQCRHCDKAFKSHRNRNVHERQHTGVKPYKCSTCSEAFYHNVVRKSHEFRRHGNEEYRYIYEREKEKSLKKQKKD